MAFELSIDQPFDLERTLRCAQGHRWRPVEGYRWVEEDGRPIREPFDEEHRGWHSSVIHGQPVWIRQQGGREDPVEFDTTADVSWMEAYLRWQFRLDEDIGRIYADLSNGNATLAQLVGLYHGLRVMRVDLWECLVFFILAARTPVRTAQRRLDDIAEAFSTSPCLPNGRHPFPRPEEVGSDSGLGKLNHLNLGLRVKRDYIYEAARRQEPNPTGRPYIGRSLDQIANASKLNPLSDAISELRKIPGVGAKTANCVALFGLGYLDAFPVDTHILATLKSLYLDQPYAGYASQFLFIEGLTHALSDERRRAF